jgi:ubiquinone/menaquinone biosynthesis C-methylase UbiE
MSDLTIPNHHGSSPGFSGLGAVCAAASMIPGRRKDAAAAAAVVGLTAGDRLVDVGCGPGPAARYAVSRAASVVGVDPSAVMLRVARWTPRPPSRRLRWVEGTAEALPLPDASADVAWALATVHHWPDLAGALAEIGRVLVPGGRFLAVERRVEPGATGHASHGWIDGQADAFADLCRVAGFTDVGVTSRPYRRGTMLAVLAHRQP